MARKKAAAGGAPEWLVTFSDLMSLLVCFFVLLISFSIQDKQKLQIVAGSIKEAFGIQPEPRRAGMLELEGTPQREFMRDVAQDPSPNDTQYATERHDRQRRQGPEAETHSRQRSDVQRDLRFATAAASLRQALQDMPEIAELSRQIMVEETEQGLEISLTDQDGRSMFPEGSAEPFERTRRVLQRLAPQIRALPNRVTVIGHTSSTRQPGLPGAGPWELSAARAARVRGVLAEFGVPSDRFAGVVGKADTEPMFPEDPYLASNRRMKILIMREAPPLSPAHKL